MHIMINRSLSDSIEALRKKGDFFEFDQFIIEKMLGAGALKRLNSRQEEIRRLAYRKCVTQMGDHHVAALQTIQKWFGIHNKSVPSREQIFQLGFALHLPEQEVRDYLKRGIREPDFQVNDYREVIFMYGLQHGLSYEEALDMIEEFQSGLPLDFEVNQHNHTNDLLGNYSVNSHLGRHCFLQWMYNYAGEFKGYSRTVLEYFKLLKKEILHEVKADAQLQLEGFLEQTSFFSWEERKRVSKKRRQKTIPQYLSSRIGKAEVSVQMAENILEMLEMAQISEESNSELLAELYADVNYKYRNYKTNNKKDTCKQRVPMDVNLMNDKYLSEMLNISIHKEKQIRLLLLRSQLHKEEETAFCPDWAWDILREYGYSSKDRQIAGILDWLDQRIKTQTRRCNSIQRKDLLPLLLCVAQKRYLKQLQPGEEYQAEKAKNVFIEFANYTLSACNMELLNPVRYEFDAVLCLCYQPEELYSLSDVLEAIVEG